MKDQKYCEPGAFNIEQPEVAVGYMLRDDGMFDVNVVYVGKDVQHIAQVQSRNLCRGLAHCLKLLSDQFEELAVEQDAVARQSKVP